MISKLPTLIFLLDTIWYDKLHFRASKGWWTASLICRTKTNKKKRNRTCEDKWHRYFTGPMSFLTLKSVKALKETQSTDPNQSPGHIFPFFNHHWTPDGSGISPFFCCSTPLLYTLYAAYDLSANLEILTHNNKHGQKCINRSGSKYLELCKQRHQWEDLRLLLS